VLLSHLNQHRFAEESDRTEECGVPVLFKASVVALRKSYEDRRPHGARVRRATGGNHLMVTSVRSLNHEISKPNIRMPAAIAAGIRSRVPLLKSALENKLRAELHSARIADGSHGSIGRRCCDVQAECGEIRMVENVEDLPAKLNTAGLAEPNAFCQCRVESRRGRPKDDVATSVTHAIYTCWRIGEARCIEKLGESMRRITVWIADHVRSSARRRATQKS
jgi:hypothetical protein